VLDALEQALHDRRPVHRGGLVHHSDRGSQYVSIKYTERLAEAGVEPSVGSVGDSYDNALAETINGLYKAELIRRRGPWRNFEAVEFATLVLGEQTFEGRRENLNQANKLSRTYTTLLEALNRHRGKGQQKVTVEHVHIHEGGQAIVSNVESPGGGFLSKSEERPHALTHAPGQEVRSANTEREAMPIARDGKR
jgi:transposase InsO family protein